jgi:protein-S-isoprenylcysteine O-methyltransferase Ste14
LNASLRADNRVPRLSGTFGRQFSDLVLFAATLTELTILFFTTETFTVIDWIYILQHLVVLGIAISRPAPKVQDRSLASSAAVAVAYLYPYAQVIYLRWIPGDPAWPAGGLVMVSVATGLSIVSLLYLGRHFGVRPALRGLVTTGPYALVRHPIYLSYLMSDIGYNLQEWNFGTALLVLLGWVSLIYRILAEERVLSQDPGWPEYAALVRYRLIPGIW